MEFEKKKFPIIVLLMLSGSFKSLECWSPPLVDVTYEDIKSLNATCEGKDSCELPKYPPSLLYSSCNCYPYCSLLDACCVDSKYKHKYKPLKHLHCDSIYHEQKFYYVPMVYGCDPDVQSNKTTEELCNSNAELSNDPFLNVPVTDPITGISYKNHYCFACNINYGAQEPLPWKLGLKSRSYKINGSIPNLYFDASKRIWIMDHERENATEVYLYISITEEILEIVPYIYNFVIISECASNWTDDNIRNKCRDYMALMRIWSDEGSYLKYYRNPHCAICNYQSFDRRDCDGYGDNHGQSYGSEDFFYGLFSLHDKISKCEENMVYDYFSKKCRRVHRSKRRQQ